MPLDPSSDQFVDAARHLLRPPDASGAREVSLRSGYDNKLLPIDEHPCATKFILNILAAEQARFKDFIYWNKKLRKFCIKEGPGLYELVTRNPEYLIKNAEMGCLKNATHEQKEMLYFLPGAVCTDLGAGADAEKLIQILRITGEREKLNLLVRGYGQEIPRIIVLVDINRSNLEQAASRVAEMLAKEYGYTCDISWADKLVEQDISGAKRRGRISIILLDKNFTDPDFFAREGLLQRAVRQELEIRGIIDWHWRLLMLGGTFHNMDPQKIDFMIGNMAELFEQPHGRSQKKGGDRFHVGLASETHQPTTNRCYDTPEFKIWSAMAFYRAVLRLGYEPFDLSAFDVTVENTGCISQLEAALPKLNWSQLPNPDGLARAIRTEFRAQEAIMLKPIGDASPLELQHVHTEAITRYAPEIWSMIFAQHDIHLGPFIAARLSRADLRSDQYQPNCAIAEYARVVVEASKPPAPTG